MELLDISAKSDDKGTEDPKGEGIAKEAEKAPEKAAEKAPEKKSAEPATKSSEDIAREGGWKPLDEWDGDAGEWRSAELFNERGIWIGKHKAQEKRMHDMQTNFDSRLENVSKLHNQQLEVQKADLVRKRDDAIDLADRETANKIQEDIDKIQPIEDAPAANPDQKVVDDWNTENPWVLGQGPKAAYARSQFGVYQTQGLSVEQSLSSVEADVSREFPAINPGRDKEPSSEGGSPPGRKVAAKKLSMGDLTSEERKFRQAMPGAWKNDAEFLQAVADSRSAE